MEQSRAGGRTHRLRRGTCDGFIIANVWGGGTGGSYHATLPSRAHRQNRAGTKRSSAMLCFIWIKHETSRRKENKCRSVALHGI